MNLFCVVQIPQCTKKAVYFYYDTILEEVFGYCEDHHFLREPDPDRCIIPISRREIRIQQVMDS
jgi:hypothetical protein